MLEFDSFHLINTTNIYNNKPTNSSLSKIFEGLNINILISINMASYFFTGTVTTKIIKSI
jgi:hypothetical protein